MCEPDRLRAELARATKRGIGMTIAGLIFWLAVAFAESWLSANNAALFAFLATGAVFPIGWAISRLLGGDIMHNGHPHLAGDAAELCAIVLLAETYRGSYQGKSSW